MRFSPVALRCSIGMFLLSLTTATAWADPYSEALADAEYALACAKLQLRLYRQVQVPGEVRQLDAAIRLTDAEIDALRHRIREYAPFEKFQTGRPLLVTTEYARLHLAEAEQRLAELENRRALHYRYRGAYFRLLARDVQRAEARLAALESGEVVVVEPAF